MRYLLGCCLLLFATIAPPATPARALAAVAVEPPAVDQSVPLGQAAQATITVRNISVANLPLRVYEAAATPPTNRRAVGETRAPLPSQPERFDPTLQAAFRAAPNQPQKFIIYLSNQVDLSAAYQISDWRARGTFVYQTLVEHANRTQAALVRELTTRGVAFRSLWVVNAIVATGTLNDAQAMLARADVALVRANHVTAVPSGDSIQNSEFSIQKSNNRQPTTDNAPTRQRSNSAQACSPSAPEEMYCWNVRMVRADATWRDFGVNGQGIVVANIDTGVALDHPALAASYRGNQNGTVSHDYNWYDPRGTFETPDDDNGHGTHTMGTMVGLPVDGANGIGVAPGARWIAARGCEDLYCDEADLIASAQWLLAPTKIDGTAPRPDLRPMIVNNSWSGAGGDRWFAPYVAAWRAAGMFPVFAAGNAGGTAQTCGSIASPADAADAVAVGAVGSNDTITNFSLIGPTRDGRTKPDFVAPGGAVYSAYPPKLGSYRVLSGTSMAAPHVAATVALLWSANPALIGDYNATYALLRDSAKKLDDARCGDSPGAPNNVYGNGRIDAYAAVERARVDVPWLAVAQSAAMLPTAGGTTLNVLLDATAAPGPGIYEARIQLYSDDLTQPLATIPVAMRVTAATSQVSVEGRVVNAETGQPVQAQVALARGETVGPAIATGVDGAFRLELVDGAGYELVASAPSFVSRRIALDRTPLEVPLQPDLPRLIMPEDPLQASVAFAGKTQRSFPIENRGTQPLFYRVDIPNDAYVIRRSDAAGGPTYNWIDLPPSASTLETGDDLVKDKIPLGMAFPFYTFSLTDTVITSDGMLTFEKPFTYRGPTTGCLPDEWITFYMIAPLRLDLDTTAGGRIRYGTVGGQFVLSYENVPLQNGAPDQVYTFQLVLRADGRIVFQYKQLGPLPNRVSAGIQRAPTEVFSLGCGTSTPVRDGLAIELRPQFNAVGWLETNANAGTLQPGQRAEIPLSLAWVRPSPQGEPYQARVLISSNDPRRNPAVQRILFTPRPAPYEVWLNLGVGKR